MGAMLAVLVQSSYGIVTIIIVVIVVVILSIEWLALGSQ